MFQECPILPDVQNGNITYEIPDISYEMPPYVQTTKAVYICEDGFVLNGDSMRECFDIDGTGVWSGSEPTCEIEGENKYYEIFSIWS